MPADETTPEFAEEDNNFRSRLWGIIVLAHNSGTSILSSDAPLPCCGPTSIQPRRQRRGRCAREVPRLDHPGARGWQPDEECPVHSFSLTPLTRTPWHVLDAKDKGAVVK